MFLENCWYVAAWSGEIGRALFERQICGESILLYRTAAGDPVALGNVCPHRFAPLSVGKLIGEEVQCGYHGFRFGTSGACVRSPLADGVIPAKMRVKRYAVVERYGMIWLWLGDPDVADESAIPNFACNDDPGFRRIEGLMEVGANYELISDNLLDLTHAEFVHEGILDSEALTKSKLETAQSGTTVWSNRWAHDGVAPPAWAAAFDDYADNVDHWAYMRWDPPGNLLLDVGVTPVGKTRGEGVWLYGCDLLTPKDATTTWYFWSFVRNYKVARAPYGAYIDMGGRQIHSFSPELFFRMEGRRIETRPMKGTRKRESGSSADLDIARSLFNSAKDRAENLMIVDLMRNDLSKICEAGSVRVPRLFALEPYPSVWQMTSTVSGRLNESLDTFDVFQALFPCGSITGAPKLMATHLIAALERFDRGLYTGAIGTMGGGNATFNVAIRTLDQVGTQGRMDVGAGIVADSRPRAEWLECLAKAAFLP